MRPAQPGATRRNPWWIPPFLGRVPPEIDDRRIALLGFVALALLFESYDMSLLGAALKYIARDLQIEEAQLGIFNGAIRFVALPAFLLIPLADVIGRRRLFLGSVIGLSVGTCLTAFSGSPAQFVACQMLARSCMLTASAVAFVIVTEEFPAATRGWGIGMLAALASMGHGLGAGLFAAVDSLPYGWRALYVVGALPLVLLPMLSRGIHETERFEIQRHRASQGKKIRSTFSEWFRPILSLLQSHPWRALGIALVGCFAALGHSVVFAFIGYFVLEYHGWPPWQYSLMFVVCGGVGIIGNIAAGRMADRRGRRSVGLFFLGGFPLVAWIFFRGPDLAIPLVWIALVFSSTAGNVIIRAFSTELFPTSQRATSAGMLVLFETLGAGVGLSLLTLLSAEKGDLIPLIPVVSIASLAAGLILLFFPETHQRELESLSHEPTWARPATGTASADPSVRR